MLKFLIFTDNGVDEGDTNSSSDSSGLNMVIPPNGDAASNHIAIGLEKRKRSRFSVDVSKLYFLPLPLRPMFMVEADNIYVTSLRRESMCT